MDRLRSGWEGNCPTCGRYSKVYHRQIHLSIALQLIQLYKLGGHEKFIHTHKLLAKGTSGVGDFSKAKYWQLITEKKHEPDDKKSSGFWRLTDLGLEFVLKKARIKKFAVVYDDRVIDAVGRLVSIEDCLQNKFSYQELMDGGGL